MHEHQIKTQVRPTSRPQLVCNYICTFFFTCLKRDHGIGDYKEYAGGKSVVF